MRKKQKKRSLFGQIVGGIVCGLAVLVILFSCTDGDKKSDAEKSTPAAADTEDTSEYDIVVKPDGRLKVVDENADKIGLFVTENLRPVLDETFGENYIITEYTNDIVVVNWDENTADDIDAIRAGNKEALAAWEECRDKIMQASEDITYALRGYVPGSNVAIALVDPRNHEDVLLVVSSGSLMYDFEIDGDMEPWLIYSNYNEEIKDRKPNL